MPRKRKERKAEVEYITIVVPKATKERLDKARGTVALSRWVRRLIEVSLARRARAAKSPPNPEKTPPQPQ